MQKLDFNQGWQVQKAGENTVKTVNLPYDAMIHEKRDPDCLNGKTTGFYPGGKYVYAKEFPVPQEMAGKKVIFEFEGVYHNAQVSVNKTLLCTKANGYTGFFVDATEVLHFGETNQIEVVADTSKEPFTRWYSGSGIYRPVWMHVSGGADSGQRCALQGRNAEPVYIEPDGIQIQTLSCDPAKVRVRTLIADACAADYEVNVRIMDGKTVVTEGTGEDIELEIPQAKLWSAKSPYLYRCEVTVSGETQTIRFGICKLSWSTEEGLTVNGETVKLRGACIHHDNGILGACEYPEAARRRVQILKEAGFNAIRSAHNPISKALLDACDELGMYVMDEFTDMWYEHKNRFDYASVFEEQYEADLTAMIRKDISHPCVVMYSIGNEVTEVAEPDGIDYAHKMSDLIRSLDGTRPVTCGINMGLTVMNFAGMGVYKPQPGDPVRPPQPKNPKAVALLKKQMEETKKNPSSEKEQKEIKAMAQMSSTNGDKKEGKLVGSEFFNETMLVMKEHQRQIVKQPLAMVLTEDAYAALDIAGYNYADGRYEQDADEYPQRISVGSETLPVRIYKNWQLVKKLDYVTGDFMWTGWDYLGEAGVGAFCYDSVGTKEKAYPYRLAGSGVIDILGNPRPEVWLDKAVFGLSHTPYIGVEPVTHSHENRLISAWRYTDCIHSWSWAGCEGKKAELIVYSDAAQVEVFVNGKSIGRQAVAECEAKFETVYEPGELLAVAYDENGKETGRDVLKTASEETVLTVKPEKTELKADGQDLCYLDIAVTDKNGIVKSSEDRNITVTVEGAGTLEGLGNANPCSEEPYDGQTHPTYYGRAQAVVRAGYEAGEIRVKMVCAGCEAVETVITVRENCL